MDLFVNPPWPPRAWCMWKVDWGLAADPPTHCLGAVSSLQEDAVEVKVGFRGAWKQRQMVGGALHGCKTGSPFLPPSPHHVWPAGWTTLQAAPGSIH